MKNVTVEDLKALDFEISVHVEEANSEFCESGSRKLTNWAIGGVHFTHQDVRLTLNFAANASAYSYGQAFNFELTEYESEEDALSINGALLVDEEGSPLEHHALTDALREVTSQYDWESEVRAVLPTPGNDETLNEVAVDTGRDPTTARAYVVNRSGEPGLAFSGWKLAVASSEERGGMFTRYRLYLTIGGKYVAQVGDYTYWDGQEDQFRVKVCQTLNEVGSFFEHEDLLEELFKAAKLPLPETA